MANTDGTVQAILALALPAISVSVSAMGQTLQRLSRVLEDRKNLDVARSPWKRKLWVLGMSLEILSGPLDAAAYLFASMGTVIVFYALKLPILTILARLILEVSISKRCIAGITLTAGGAMISLIFTPEQSEEKLYTVSDFFTADVRNYVILTVVALGLLFVAVLRYKSQVALPVLAAWCLSVQKLFNSGLGQLGDGENWLSLEWIWIPIVIGIFAFLVAVVQASAFEQMSTHIFMPVSFGFTAVIMAIQGTLIGEYANMPKEDMVYWIIGLVCAVIGTSLVAWGTVVGAEAEEKAKEVEKAKSLVALEEATLELK